MQDFHFIVPCTWQEHITFFRAGLLKKVSFVSVNNGYVDAAGSATMTVMAIVVRSHSSSLWLRRGWQQSKTGLEFKRPEQH